MNFLIRLLFKLILHKYSLFFIIKSNEEYEAFYINRICIDDEMKEIVFEYDER